MGITIQWDNPERTVLRYEFSGMWTWDEFFSAQAYRRPMLEGIWHTVHHLVIFLPDQQPPSTFTLHATKIDSVRFKYSGLYAIVGASSFIRVTAGVLRRMGNTMARDAYFFDTIEEAYYFLQVKQP
jgi:hypothetical protein